MTARMIFFEELKKKVLKAIQHLEYSYNKVTHLPVEPNQLDEESLETWESFATRFCRVADVFFTKYLRAFMLLQDPGFNGSFRDLVNQAELRLYGSRLKENLKGGDIDLLLLLEQPNSATKLTENKHYILSAIKKYLDDQKIDLVISSKEERMQDAFLKMIFPESLVLKRWGVAS